MKVSIFLFFQSYSPIYFSPILFPSLLSQLFYILYKMIALQQIGSFDNSTNPHEPTISLQKSTLSPQGNYLLRYDPNNNFQRLYDLREESVKKITVCPRNNCIIIKAQFSNDEKFIFYTDSKEIGMFQRQAQISFSIVPFDRDYNEITDMKLSYNNSLLYFINKTSLSTFQFSSSTILPIKTQQNDCSASKIALNPNQNQIITSSLKQGLRVCTVCNWNLEGNTFTSTLITTISNCLVNQIKIIDNMVVITNKINNNWLNSYVLDIKTFSTLAMTKMVNQITAGFVVEYHNYRLEYFSRYKTGYIYRNNFTTVPFQVNTKYPLTIKYDKFKDVFYVMQLENSTNTLKKYVATFNCLNITNSTIYIDNPYATDCICQDGLKFNKSSLKCQTYDPKKGQMLCDPLKGQTFNTFNLKCQLNCSVVSNTVPVSAYGSPLKCLCNQPYVWNKLQSNCNFIDCSLISNAIIGFGKTCQCLQGYLWDNLSQICSQSPILPTNSTQNITTQQSSSSSSTGLIVSIILILIALITAIIYYYKRCRNQPSDAEEIENKPDEVRQSDRRMNEFKTGGVSNNIQSNQYLDKKPETQSDTKSDKKHSFRLEHQDHQNVDNFSIGDDAEEKIEDQLSVIESNIQNPLN